MIRQPDLERLRTFVMRFGDLIAEEREEAELLVMGARLLAELVKQDDWLPAEYAEPNPERYCQYLLHCDSRERFSVVSFVWGPGQATPVHDHRTWGLIGMLRGAEDSTSLQRMPDGGIAPFGTARRLEPGAIDAVSPTIGDIHRVANAYDDRVSISIHVYGGNIGRISRATYDANGNQRSFISGYSNKHCPNIWAL